MKFINNNASALNSPFEMANDGVGWHKAHIWIVINLLYNRINGIFQRICHEIVVVVVFRSFLGFSIPCKWLKWYQIHVHIHTHPSIQSNIYWYFEMDEHALHSLLWTIFRTFSQSTNRFVWWSRLFFCQSSYRLFLKQTIISIDIIPAPLHYTYTHLYI